MVFIGVRKLHALSGRFSVPEGNNQKNPAIFGFPIFVIYAWGEVFAGLQFILILIFIALEVG